MGRAYRLGRTTARGADPTLDGLLRPRPNTETKGDVRCERRASDGTPDDDSISIALRAQVGAGGEGGRRSVRPARAPPRSAPSSPPSLSSLVSHPPREREPSPRGRDSRDAQRC
ncbi:hypothetical protein ACHAWF_003677 [Thalassiosira exigua]